MHKKNILLLLFILLKFVLQFFAVHPVYELHRDEFLHLDLGRHLAWGYSSVPPVTGLISYVIHVLGNSVFWVKFFPALFGALTLVVVWKTVEAFKGGLFACGLAATGILFSVLLRINTLYQPNSLDYLMWTLLFFTIIRFIQTENNRWLYFAGLTFAVGFLNKYNIGFLVLGLLPAVLIAGPRNIFRNKHLWFAAILALIIILPNLVWQIRNDFPVVHHLTILASTQLVNVHRLDILKEQLFFFTGSLIVIVFAWISFFIYPPFKSFRFLFYTFLFTLAAFVYLRAKPYYAIGLYPVFLSFGAVYLGHVLQRGPARFMKPVFLLLPVVLIAAIWQIMLPVLSPEEIHAKKERFEKFGMLRWEDGMNHQLPQDFADMTGWKELAGIADSALQLVDNKSTAIIQCDNYGQAGAVNYYSRQKVNNALSMNADYINWYPLYDFKITDVILIKEKEDKGKNAEEVKSFFEKVLFIGKITNVNAREYGTSVYLLKGAKVSVNQILAAEIEERKENQP